MSSFLPFNESLNHFLQDSDRNNTIEIAPHRFGMVMVMVILAGRYASTEIVFSFLITYGVCSIFFSQIILLHIHMG